MNISSDPIPKVKYHKSGARYRKRSAMEIRAASAEVAAYQRIKVDVNKFIGNTEFEPPEDFIPYCNMAGITELKRELFQKFFLPNAVIDLVANYMELARHQERDVGKALFELVPKFEEIPPLPGSISLAMRASKISMPSGDSLVLCEVNTRSDQPLREGADHVWLIDISGSTQNLLTSQYGGQEIPNSGLNDLMRSAMETIIPTLKPGDRIALVPFNKTPKFTFKPQFATDAAKQQLLEIVQNRAHHAPLEPGGETDLLVAYTCALNLIATIDAANREQNLVRNKVLTVFWDGQNDTPIHADTGNQIYNTFMSSAPEAARNLWIRVVAMQLKGQDMQQARNLTTPFGDCAKIIDLQKVTTAQLIKVFDPPAPNVTVMRSEVRLLEHSEQIKIVAANVFLPLSDLRTGHTTKFLIQGNQEAVKVHITGLSQLTNKHTVHFQRLELNAAEQAGSKKHKWLQDVVDYRTYLEELNQAVLSGDPARLKSCRENLLKLLSNISLEHINIIVHALEIFNELDKTDVQEGIKKLTEILSLADQRVFYPEALEVSHNTQAMLQVAYLLKAKGLLRNIPRSEVINELKKKFVPFFVRFSSAVGLVVCWAEPIKTDQVDPDIFEMNGTKYKIYEELFQVQKFENNYRIYITNETSPLNGYCLKTFQEFLWAIPILQKDRVLYQNNKNVGISAQLDRELKGLHWKHSIIGKVVLGALNTLKMIFVYPAIGMSYRIVYGTKAGCQKIKNLFLAAQQPAARLANRVGSFCNAASEVISTLFSTTKSFIEDITLPIRWTVSQVVKSTAAILIIIFIKIFYRPFTFTLTMIGKGLSKLFESTVSCLQSIYNWADRQITKAVNSIGNALSACFQTVMRPLRYSYNKLTGPARALVDAISSIYNLACALVSDAWSLAKWIGRQIMQLVRSVGSAISSLFKQIIVTPLRLSFRILKATVKGVIDIILSIAETSFEFSKDFIQPVSWTCNQLAKIIKAIFNSVVRPIGEALGTGAQKIYTVLCSIGNKFQACAQAAFNVIKAVFNKMLAPVYWAGRQIRKLVETAVDVLKRYAIIPVTNALTLISAKIGRQWALRTGYKRPERY